jgi:AraC-like DNA-binding protein
LVVHDVRCRAERSTWTAPEAAESYTLVFVRRGTFYRRAAGSERLMDATCAYLERPGVEQQIAHPHTAGDACTAIELSEEMASLLADNLDLRAGEPLFTRVDTALALQKLTRCVRRQDDFELTETVVRLVSGGTAERDGRLRAVQPSTHITRRRIIDQTREALAAEPRASLRHIASMVSVSPHHLSRVFHADTGATVSAYRNQLRVRGALERLAEGEPSLTRLAHDLGFADHAHMTRTMQRHTGASPSALRRAFTIGQRVSSESLGLGSDRLTMNRSPSPSSTSRPGS